MLHLFRYRFLQTVRDHGTMFWALAFPLILATFFYLSFGRAGMSATGESEWEPVRIAVVREEESSDEADAFTMMLKELDGEIVDIRDTSSEEDSLSLLRDGEISGIFYVRENPSLTVRENGLNESILTSVLGMYRQNFSIIAAVAAEHPESLGKALKELGDYPEAVHETSLGGKTLDPTLQYFFALIGYTCLSGLYLGIRASADIQANLTPLGARRSVTPTHKLTLILVDMLVLVAIHFCNVLILNLYIVKVLGISLGDDIPALLLVDLMGSVIGVCIGLAFGCISRLSFDLKIGIGVALSLFPGFLAGMMFVQMKDLVDRYCPVVNHVNPAAVLSDAFYCMSVYSDPDRFRRCILTLAGMSILFLALAFSGIRRERYDSI